jgi:hypothetical protein
MQYPDLKEIAQRPKKYWNADGVPDLVMGAVLILWGAALALPAWLHLGEWNWLWVVMVFSSLAANAVIKKLKQHFTFPRTGYVEWAPPSGVTKMVTAFLGAGVAAAFVFLMRAAKVQGFMELLPPAFALLGAFMFLIIAIWHKFPHYLWISALSLTLAIILIRNPMDLTNSFILLWLSLGACICLAGGVRLYAYLRRNPRQAEDEA